MGVGADAESAGGSAARVGGAARGRAQADWGRGGRGERGRRLRGALGGQGVGERGRASQRSRGPYRMRGIGGQFGVWVGRADYGGRRAGGVGAGQRRWEAEGGRGFGAGGGLQAHPTQGGGVRAPPAHERHGLSRAEWLYRVTFRRARPEPEVGPRIVVHHHHHYHN